MQLAPQLQTQKTYALVGSDRTSQIKLNYSGSIYDLAEQDSEEYAQSFFQKLAGLLMSSEFI